MQSPSPAALDGLGSGLSVPAQTAVAFGTDDDGITWASGTSYKASFGPDGATYIPRFGPDVPRNYPVSMTLGRVLAGGAQIDLQPVSTPVRHDHTFTIDRGPIDEVYEVALGHLEQKFVVKERPSAGALDLFVPLSSDLELGSKDGNIELFSEHGVVNYSRAFALLDDGSRVPLETIVENDAVRIHVDAEFMASARFPLVIDPIVSNFSITLAGFAPTISYDLSTDRYLIAWDYPFSFGDHDILWHLRGANGTPFANGVADNSANDCMSPSAANLGGQSQFLLVYQRKGAPSTPWNIWGRTIQSGTAVQSGSFIISTDPSGENITPDVGGDPYFGEAYYCVVWQNSFNGEQNIHGRLVQSNTVLIGSSALLIDNTVGTNDATPSISKSNGQLAAAAWTVVWTRFLSPGSRIYACRLSYIGVVLNPPTEIVPQFSGFNNTNPTVSTPRADGRVCLVYSQENYLVYTLVNGVTVEATGSIYPYWTPPEAINLYHYGFAVDTDGTAFFVAYSQVYGGPPFAYLLTLRNVTPTTLTVVEGLLLLGQQSTSKLDITSKYSSGGPSHECAIVWDGGGIDGATFQRRNGGPYSTVCAGSGVGNQCPCSNSGSSGHGCANSAHASGALLTPNGAAATGALDTFSFALSSTPSGSPALLFQGTFSGTFGAFGDGVLCTAGTITRFAVRFPDASGTMIWPQTPELPLSVQGGIPLAGATRLYQAYYRDSATFCTIRTFNISNGASVTWLP